ncbi:MAG: tripartite tricarboxylate transporter substrate binding protein [Burkholderiales bacterium]|nr:tripartite tricarboxylate transporter substrate binding protein [Burkholderiales bacterium]
MKTAALLATVATLAPLALAAMPALAQAPSDGAFPSRALRFLVPFAPGGGNDFIARTLAQRLSEGLGQPVLVDNRAGGGGLIATELAARAQPDGYTLLLGFIGPFSISPAMQKVNYDPVRDFISLDFFASSYHLLIAHPSVPVKTVKDLVAHAKANPGRLNYASSGSGANLHLSGELFKMVTGTDIVHIPYKGAGPAAAAVLAGEAQLLFSSITAALPLARAGRVTALAVTSPKRSPLAPDVPTLNEQGIFNVEVPSWYTLMAPAKTSRAAAERLRAEVRRVVAIPEFRDTLAKQAIDVQVMPQSEFTTFLKADMAKYATVVKKAKITAE